MPSPPMPPKKDKKKGGGKKKKAAKPEVDPARVKAENEANAKAARERAEFVVVVQKISFFLCLNEASLLLAPRGCVSNFIMCRCIAGVRWVEAFRVWFQRNRSGIFDTLRLFDSDGLA